MDLFYKAKDSFASAGKGITTKANDVSGIARLSLKIKEEEKNLQDAIKKLGEQMYENHLDEATKFFPELMYSIKMTQGEIARCKKELADESKFCMNCGEKVE